MSMIKKGSLLDIQAEANGWVLPKNAPIPLIDIAELTNENWLHCRAHGPHWDDPTNPGYIDFAVGGSDTAAICGISPWVTSLDLFHQKVGIEPAYKSPGNVAAFEAGHTFEPFVAEVALRLINSLDWVHSVEMFDDTTMYRCGQRNEKGDLRYPWALADFDRLAVINDVPHIVELKTTSYRNYDVIDEWRSGIVPIYYETQVRHYMAVANIDHAVIICAWGFKSDECAIIFIDRDLDIEEELMKNERNFVDACRAGIEPDLVPQNKSLLMKYYAEFYGIPISENDEGGKVELDPTYKPKVDRIIEAQAIVEEKERELKQAKARYDEVCAELIPAFVNDDGSRICEFAYINDVDTNSHIGISVNASKARPVFDEARFKVEHPDEWQECLETTFSTKKLAALDKKCRTRFSSEYKTPPAVSSTPSLKLKVKVSPLDE